MKLFKDVPRQDSGPKPQIESIYSYLKRSARPEVEEVRILLENCFANYPEDAKAELKSRMVKGIEYDSAAFELLLHEMLLLEGYEIQTHPQILGTTKTPDFLVRRGDTSFYLEAVIARDMSNEKAALRKAEDDVYDTINAAEPFDYWLQIISIERKTKQSHSAKALKAFLREELGKLDVDYLDLLLEEEGALESLPILRFDDSNTTIDIRPIPRSPAKRGNSLYRNIGVFPMESRVGSPRESIQASIKSKVSRYGKLSLPYVIAVNSTSFWQADQDDIKEALYGSETIEVSPYGTRLVRKPDGIFVGPEGIQNTRVSAVLFGSVAPSSLSSAKYPRRNKLKYTNGTDQGCGVE